ncbi:MAG TPA: sensor histidine kinase [Prolixibacteraceae bacterium]|nr:sensor histidine kinase [Prolixibacteraceae bacterium]
MKKHLASKRYSIYIRSLIEKPFLFNVVVWGFVLVILSLLMSLNSILPFNFYFFNMLVTLPAMILFCYTMDWLANKYLFQLRRVVFFFLSFTVMTIVCSLLIPLLNHSLFFGLIYPRMFEPVPWFNWRLVPQNMIILWLPYFIISIKTFFVHWFMAEQDKLILENKRLLAEIQLMKIKLHPHFLFNTLNNLYAMAKVNCENTSEYIMKLSEIYRIMLYECNKDFYKVNEELKLIRNYIELEKIRYDKRLKLEVSIPEMVEDDLMIPPLMFFTFIENSFKHGCSQDVGNPFVRIEIQSERDFLIFRSENSVPDHTPVSHGDGGFGLENTRKRLDLVFENEYIFKNEKINHHYEVYLKIPKLYSS